MLSLKKILTPSQSDDETKSVRDDQGKGVFHAGLALQRLMYVAAIGSSLIVLYAFRNSREGSLGVASAISVGLMAGGAALLAGGLLGFLFGVPHTRDEATPQRRNGADDQRESAQDTSTTYRPNTSLEQIADWLTKILVGVGLVQIQAIPGKLVALASYVSRGLGEGPGSETFALAILIYFSVCGFVFGFLWARIYLPRWFRDADEIQILEEKVSQLETRQAADARALALIDKVINRGPDDPPVPESEVVDAIVSASKPVRTQIFRQAEKTSANKNAEDYDVKNEGVVSILHGLIKSDTKERYHRNHSELGHALRRIGPQDWGPVESAYTKAIEIRNKLGIKWWKSYEFHRARCRIERDENFKNSRPSDQSVSESILVDLRTAFRDTEKWKRWSETATGDSAYTIQKWRDLNQVNDDVLAQ